MSKVYDSGLNTTDVVFIAKVPVISFQHTQIYSFKAGVEETSYNISSYW